MRGKDCMIADIARYHQEALTPRPVVPKFAMASGWIIAQINVRDEAFASIRRGRVGALERAVTLISKFPHIAQTAMRTGNAHARLNAGSAGHRRHAHQ